MTDITCARCKETRERLKAPTLPGELGAKIYDEICTACWQEWLKEQTAIINHYGLSVLDPDAKKFLLSKTTEFFFGPETEPTE
ncbi:MAG: oxidative damage protection protein [Gemmatimonadota bacterium]|nr:oxidative damage protection protein [Gemmatimonadota bacterium]MDH5805355.1 oxidative damage protection protein [Gemmatimonadota bacterium]